MKREIILIAGLLIVAAIASGCTTAAPSRANSPTPVVKTITIQTDSGEVIVFPLCKDRTICYQITSPAGSGFSCMSEENLPIAVMDSYCQGNY